VNPGNHTVTFVVAGSEVSRDKNGVAVKPVTSTDVKGCFMQPLSVHDMVGDTNFAESTHKCLAPGSAPAIKPEDHLLFHGVSYRVTGVKVFDTWNGVTDHVTVICEKQEG
jgi:hypothetical protein